MSVCVRESDRMLSLNNQLFRRTNDVELTHIP